MFRNGRLFKRQVNSIPKVLSSSSASKRNKKQSDILNLIPPRVNRTPTDILKALSLVVGRDPTSFHYQIPDDPFLYPLSSFQKKKRLLAIESGRKSARWIVENHPKFFKHNLAEPPVKTFLNKPVYDENSEVTEETLLGLIQDRNVSQAIAVYNLLKNKSIDVSKGTKQSLLELVCFYNSKDRPDEKNLWSKWYELDRKTRNVWMNNDFVKELFDTLEPEGPLAYAALIQGMLKHDNLEEAMELFGAGKEKKLKFPAGVYNLIIENVPRLEEDPFKKFNAVQDYLAEMAQEKIKPNLGTLNSVLSAISRISGISLPEKESFICKLLADFENLKIYPSLGSYYYILKIFVEENDIPQMKFGVAWSVMSFLKTKRWTVQHPSDFLFFHFAMQIFCFGLKSMKLAQSLMDLYLDHDHYKFLNVNFAETIFFDYYINITFTSEDLEKSMQVYRYLIPSQTFLDIRRYGTILKVFLRQKRFEYLGEIWKDMKQYCSHQFSRASGILGLVIQPVSLFKKEETPEYFNEVAQTLLKLLDTTQLEPKTLGSMLITFVRFEDENKVSVVMDFINEGQVLFIEPFVVEEAFAFAMSKKNIPLIKNCLKLFYRENHPKLKAMGKKALALFEEADKRWLNEILKKVDEENKNSTVEKTKLDSENAA